MHFLLVLIGILIVLIAGWDLFLTLVLPGTIIGAARLTRAYYRTTAPVVGFVFRHLRSQHMKRSLLAIYGPLSFVALIFVWVGSIILGYTFIHWGINMMYYGDRHHANFKDQLYFSGSTFFTLSFGDVIPGGGWARLAAILEAGTGLGTLAIIISYLPVLYQSFSQREAGVTLFTTRAGSPPSAAGLLHRYAQHKDKGILLEALQQQEVWCSRLLESHTSYPILGVYRSQNPQHSWLGTLCLILDMCALLQVGFSDHPEWGLEIVDQAELTFTMGSRVAIVLCGGLGMGPSPSAEGRFTDEKLKHLIKLLENDGLFFEKSAEAKQRLWDLRELYEPYLNSISNRLFIDLPPFLPNRDEYQPTTAKLMAQQAIEDVMIDEHLEDERTTD